jgi:hypothetical protein
MNRIPLLAAAAFAVWLCFPGQSQAQSRGLGNGGTGMFGGDGSGLGGLYNSSAYGNRRNYTFAQDPYAGAANQTSNSSYVQTLGNYGLGSSSFGTTLSPYLNLLRSGGVVGNYVGNVRPQLNQQAQNWATQYKLAERQGEEEMRSRQGVGQQEVRDWASGYKLAEREGEKEARIRAGEEGEPEYKDWATSYKDQEIKGEAKAEKDRSRSKQRAANLEQAKALKELDAELSASADRSVLSPSLGSGLSTYHGPGYGSQFRTYTHFYPTQGGPVGRIGGGAGSR